MPDYDTRWRQTHAAEVPSAPGERWKQLVGDLPDVRLSKVLSARRALRRDDYASESILDETLRRLSIELGISSRGGFDSGTRWTP